MLNVGPEALVTKFWDYPLSRINEETLEEVKTIVNFREQILNKVKSGEWTEKEYKQFAGVIKVMRIKNFVNFIEIANTVVSMDMEECKREVELNLLGFDKEIKSEPHMLACIIEKVQSRILSLAKVCILEDEKNVNKELEDDIEFCKQLYSEISNSNSDYVLTLKEFYKDWVNSHIVSESLKLAVLNQEDRIIKVKQDAIKTRLNKLQLKKDKKQVVDIRLRHQEAAIKARKMRR